MKAMFRFISRHPWLYVVLAFVLLIASWVALILVATRHPNPEFKLPLHPCESSQDESGRKTTT